MSEAVAIPSLLLDVPHEVYHADPWGAEPSLSRGSAHLLVARSPLHAWSAHPRLGGILLKQQPEEVNAARDGGSLMHSLLFGGGPEFVVIDAADWRKQAIREQRDEALARGAVPVLAKVYNEARGIAGHYRSELLSLGVNPLACGREVVALWREGDVLCRARMDLVSAEDGAIYDAKFLRNGRPKDFARAMIYDGYDIQTAAYTRGLAAARPMIADRVRMEFLLCETSPPYAVARVPIAESMRSLGEQRWLRAVRLWRECLAAGKWPGYGTEAIEAPPWALSEEFDSQLKTPEPEWAKGS